MNERQKRFVDFYVQTGNASEAARLAGYSKNFSNRIGDRLLTKVDISAEIERRLDELKSQRTADTQEILEHLTSVIRGEVSEEVVTQSGKKFVAKVTERDRLKAAEMLLKVQGAFRDKIDVKVDTSTLFVTTLEKIWSDVDANP